MSLTTLALLAVASTADAQSHAPSPAGLESISVASHLAWTWLAMIASIFVYRWTLYLLRHVRTLANLQPNDGKQRFFSIADDRMAMAKRYILDAPLFRKRHNREFKLSAATNCGTLPSRFQTMFLLGYIAINITFCVVSIDWSQAEAAYLSDLRNRTGVLAVMNMLPLFLLAGRNNPLIPLLDISFDSYNLIHRWIGRIVVLEALAHACAWMASKPAAKGSELGWKIVLEELKPSSNHPLMISGMIGLCAVTAILLLSPSVLRHAWYEVFLHVHILLVVTAVAAVWVHLDTLPPQALLLAALVLWIAERLYRVVTLVRRNTGHGGTRAEVEAMPGDAVRVTLRLARPWAFRPGQHVYLYIPSVGLWTSHPFSLAWSDQASSLASEKSGLPLSRADLRSKTTMSLIVRRRTGFTDALWRRASASTGGRFIACALVEGPYGSQSLASYGTVLLFAAGVGITHQVPHVRALVAGYAAGTVATRKVVLVWTIQAPEHLEWIRPWMTTILGMERRRDVLKILLFVTRPRSTKEVHSPSSSVQMFPGRPDVGALLAAEQARQIGAMAVSVCGTGGLSDDVRRACRERCEATEIDFVENAFSW